MAINGIPNIIGKRGGGVIREDIVRVKDSEIKDTSGAPTEEWPEGTLIVNTAENRLYVRTKGSADTPSKLFLKFNESTGTTASDSSGNSKDFTVTNGANWAAGKYDNAYDFNAVEKASIAGEAHFAISGAFCFECWAYCDEVGTAYYSFYSAHKDVNNYFLFGLSNAGGLYFEIKTAGASQFLSLDISLTPFNQWAHYAVTRNATGITRTYINGDLVETTASITNDLSIDNTYTVYAGYDEAHDIYMTGLIDELKVWNTERQESEINNDLLNGDTALIWTYAKLRTA